MADVEENAERRAHLAPPAYFRIAVAVGVATVLLGLSGLFWLNDRPPPPAFVRVHGVAEALDAVPGSTFTMEAKWEDGNGELRGEAGTEGRDKDVWLFYAAPEATEVTLIVWRRTEAGREEVARNMQPLRRGKLTSLKLR